MKNTNETHQVDQLIQKPFSDNSDTGTAVRLEKQMDAFRSDLKSHSYVKKLERTHKRKNTRPLILSWPMKVALSVALTITVGAVAMAVGLRIYRYHFEGKRADGMYLFTTAREVVYKNLAPTNGANGTVVSRVTATVMDYDPPNGTTNLKEVGKIGQMQQDLDETDQLRECDERELTGVTDLWVNGYFHRICHFLYTLADGRIHKVNEGDPELQKQPSSEQMKRYQDEISRLRNLGQGEVVQIIESEVAGNIFRIYAYEYTLSDGHTERVGECGSDPALCKLVLRPEQDEEVWRLRSLRKGEYLGTLDREIDGHLFSLETYKFTLNDGTVVTHAVGERKNRKKYLTDADREELQSLRKLEAGEFLDRTESEVMGRMISFERHRYILSDGTEVIFSVGKPSDDR